MYFESCIAFDNGINILTGNGICLTGNGDVPQWEWGCDSPGMRILTGNVHRLYRVFMSDLKSMESQTA